MWKKLRLWLLGLLGLATVSAGTGQMLGFMPGLDVTGGFFGSGDSSLTFIGCTYDGTPATVFTFSAQNVGTAGATRRTFVFVSGEDSATVFGVSGVTVGGDAATEVVDEDGTGVVDSALYVFLNTAGTSEDIVVTWSEAITRMSICVWESHNLTSSTAVASVADDDTASGVLALSLNTSANGIVIAGCMNRDAASSATWTGLTESSDAVLTDITVSTANASAIPAETPRTVTCDLTSAEDATGIAASFQ